MPACPQLVLYLPVGSEVDASRKGFCTQRADVLALLDGMYFQLLLIVKELHTPVCIAQMVRFYPMQSLHLPYPQLYGLFRTTEAADRMLVGLM